MYFENEGLTIWSGPSDAPCPADVVEAGKDNRVKVGMKPADPSNVVKIVFTVNGGGTREARAKWVWTHPESGAQYFEADLGTFEAGDYVEYAPIGACAGRRVGPIASSRAAASFRVFASVQSQLYSFSSAIPKSLRLHL